MLHYIVFKDFSTFSLSFQGSQGRLSSVPQKAELQIKLSPVFCELDISIVDRLNSLLQPQKLTTVEMMASHMYTSYNKHINLVSEKWNLLRNILNFCNRKTGQFSNLWDFFCWFISSDKEQKLSDLDTHFRFSDCVHDNRPKEYDSYFINCAISQLLETNRAGQKGEILNDF